MNKDIRFIDSQYNELFRISDGGKVRITASDGYETVSNCKFIDDYHFYLGNECLHICQFAEIMERNGSKYEPVIENTYTLDVPTADEISIIEIKDNKSECGLIGRQSGEFNRDDRIFWSSYEKETAEQDLFRNEYNEVMNFLRLNKDTPLLANSIKMKEICLGGKGFHTENSAFDMYSFKVVSENNTHYIKCFLPKEKNSINNECRFWVSSFDNKQLQIYKDIQYVKQNYNYIESDKFFKTANGFTELYYNPDSNAGGQIVHIDFGENTIKEAAKLYKNPEEFFSYIESAGKGYLIDAGTPEFRAAFDNFKNIKGDFEGATKKTMQSLMKAAGIKPKSKDIER